MRTTLPQYEPSEADSCLSVTDGPTLQSDLDGSASEASVTDGIAEALRELHRLTDQAREAVLGRAKFRALSALVAIQPLVGHLIEECNRPSGPVSVATEAASSNSGYL